MAKDWTSVRVQRKTLDRLTTHRRKMMEEHITGKRDLPESQVDGVTVDWMLNWLIDQVEAHRARAAKQRARKGKAKEADGESA